MTELSTVPKLALLKAEAELKNWFQAGFWQLLFCPATVFGVRGGQENVPH